MRHFRTIIILTILIIGCINKSKHPEIIEFASYDLRRFRDNDKLEFICRYFAISDEKRNLKIAVAPYNLVPRLEYFIADDSLLVFKKIMDDIAIALEPQYFSKLDLRPEGPSTYDGQFLIIRVSYNNSNKIIYFWEDELKSKIYEKLYQHIDSLYKSNSLIKISDTLEIYNKRELFIRSIIKPDSLIALLPPYRLNNHQRLK